MWNVYCVVNWLGRAEKDSILNLLSCVCYLCGKRGLHTCLSKKKCCAHLKHVVSESTLANCADTDFHYWAAVTQPWFIDSLKPLQTHICLLNTGGKMKWGVAHLQRYLPLRATELCVDRRRWFLFGFWVWHQPVRSLLCLGIWVLEGWRGGKKSSEAQTPVAGSCIRLRNVNKKHLWLTLLILWRLFLFVLFSPLNYLTSTFSTVGPHWGPMSSLTLTDRHIHYHPGEHVTCSEPFLRLINYY